MQMTGMGSGVCLSVMNYLLYRCEICVCFRRVRRKTNHSLRGSKIDDSLGHHRITLGNEPEARNLADTSLASPTTGMMSAQGVALSCSVVLANSQQHSQLSASEFDQVASKKSKGSISTYGGDGQ